jgi:hypothetical protein
VSGNTALSGAGIFLTGGVHLALMEQSAIRDNVARAFGGGVRAPGIVSIALYGSSISNNTAGCGAGGVYAEGVTLLVVRSCICDNQASGGRGCDSSGGGGVWLRSLASRSANLTLVDSSISRNSAQRSGGGVYAVEGAVITLRRSTVSANQLREWGKHARLHRCTLAYACVPSHPSRVPACVAPADVVAQTAIGGAGIYISVGDGHQRVEDSCTATLTIADSSTITRNRCPALGGGVFAYGANVSLTGGSIITENIAEVQQEPSSAPPVSAHPLVPSHLLPFSSTRRAAPARAGSSHGLWPML